jgi:RNA polymerase sigma factor (sigma-70 family)
MATGNWTPVLRYIRQVRGGPAHAGASDAQLLEHFTRRGDEAAFTALVERHGPMVLGVCRRVLRHAHDADDAFQATFLLLARKARSLSQPELLGRWLHGVAYRTALKARGVAARRRIRQRPLEDVAANDDEAILWRDLRPVLDEAIHQLPLKYRVPVILCYLEGLTNAQAAGRLGCPVGTVATRLARARDRLRTRLTRHGLALSAGLLTAGLSEALSSPAVSAAQLDHCVRSAVAFAAGTAASGGVISPQVIALTKGVLQGMFLHKLRIVLGVLLALGVAGAGVGLFAHREMAAAPPPAEEEKPVYLVRFVDSGTTPPTEEAKPLPPDAPATSNRTANFVVEATSRRIAQLVAEAAERHRKAAALAWLGKELPDWSERCPIKVTITLGGTGGATSFSFDKGKVASQSMHLEGTLERILTGCLPHEVTHTVFAHHFGCPLPRWADEGAAVLAEDEEEQQRHEKLAHKLLDTPGRAIPLRRLLPMRDFPTEVMALYAEGYSLTHYLVEKKDRKTFLAFVKQGNRGDWDRAVRDHYDFHSVEELEEAWLAALGKERRREAARENTGSSILTGADRRYPSAPPPSTVLARVDKNGVLIVRRPVATYRPTQSIVKRPGQDDQIVTTYELIMGEQEKEFELSQVQVVGTNGKPLTPEMVRALLEKERPVLVSADGKPVDPFYLQVIKENTPILVLPEEAPVVPPVPTLPPGPPPTIVAPQPIPAAPPVPTLPPRGN